MDEDMAAPAEEAKRRRSPIRWSSRRRADFLDHLAATCNIKESAAAAGVAADTVYKVRRRDRDFREAWGEALAAGYQLLETQLVGHALAGGGAAIANGDVARTGPIDVELAMRLLREHRSVKAAKAPGGVGRQVATREETDAAILRKLAAVEKRLRREAAPVVLPEPEPEPEA